MLEAIEALDALEVTGTMTEAAARLRLTQSAVSKRIRSLEATLGMSLVEPEGRRVRLAPEAVAFLDRARPLVAELRGLVHPSPLPARPPRLSLALADSIASSWGPAVVRRALASLPGSRIDLHAHRSVLVIESVRLGRYDAGLCTEMRAASDLVCHPLVDEPIVLVHRELQPRLPRGAPLVTIEPSSATWRAIEAALASRHPHLAAAPKIPVESFGAAAQMAREGFGNALLPVGLAHDLRLPRRGYRLLAGVSRKVVLYARKTVSAQPGFAMLRDELVKATTARLVPRSAEANR